MVTKGQHLLTLHTDTPERFDRAVEALEGAWAVADPGTVVETPALILDRLA
ncbi:hypothetical protein D3C74_506480 [compost metagenome]